MKTAAYAATAADKPLAPFTLDRREPGPRDVAIDILFCGLCHSDVVQVRNEFGRSKYPFVPGHEIVGRVARVGEQVSRVKVGDLVVVPGHVLMIIGHVDGEPYVIQDVLYAVFKAPATQQLRKTKLNQVSVTPLLPLYADDTTLYVDAMTSLVHVTQP